MNISKLNNKVELIAHDLIALKENESARYDSNANHGFETMEEYEDDNETEHLISIKKYFAP